VKCDDIVNSTQCVNDTFNLIGKRCVLVESEEPICVVESCSDISEVDKCDGYSSALGKCFLNGDVQQNVTQRSCTNMEDIEHCDQLLTLSLCNNATISIYRNLQGDGINRYLCKWDPAIQVCQSRVSENEKDIPIQTKLNVALIVAIVVIFVVLVPLIVVLIVFLFRRRAKTEDSHSSSSVDPEEDDNQNKKSVKF
jgi:cbb3-type cytochrome oxidase subunit 3